MNDTKKLRVGILINSWEVQAWTHHMLNIIQQSDYASIELVVVNQTPAIQSNRTLAEKIKNNSGRLWFLAVRSVLDIISNLLVDRTPTVDPADARVDSSPLLQGIPTFEVAPRQTEFSDYFPEDAVNRIKAADLDVIIRSGFRILRGDILHAARAGVWSFHHGDNRVNRGGPAGFWEVMESAPVIGSMLQILTEDMDNGLVLERTWTRTNINGISDSRSKMLWKSLYFVPRNLRELHILGPEKYLSRAKAQNETPEIYSNPLYRQPGNAEFAKMLWRKTFEKISSGLVSRFYTEQWQLMFRFGEDISTTLYRFQKILPPDNRNWADPFIVRHESIHHVFFEDFAVGEPGRLSVITLDDSGKISEPKTVLSTGNHLSYPFIFQDGGEYFMVPESIDTGKISLYRCTSFPDQWELHSHIMEGVTATDATLHFQDGKWWLFACIAQREHFSTSDELFLFFSDDFRSGEWTPHPLNPIVSDVRNARPAGKIIKLNGKWYRPAQISAPSYGYGINLNEIVVLSEDDYQEVCVTSATPHWDKNVLGLHTLAYEPGLTVIDARFWKLKWPWLHFLGL